MMVSFARVSEIRVSEATSQEEDLLHRGTKKIKEGAKVYMKGSSMSFADKLLQPMGRGDMSIETAMNLHKDVMNEVPKEKEVLELTRRMVRSSLCLMYHFYTGILFSLNMLVVNVLGEAGELPYYWRKGSTLMGKKWYYSDY